MALEKSKVTGIAIPAYSHNAGSQQQAHIIGLDVVRFAAAMLVVLFHYGLLTRAASANAAGLPHAEAIDISASLHFGWVGVQIFFVLSGFVIALSAQYASASTFFISRFTRLVPGVWVCAPVSLLAAQLLNPSALQIHLHEFVSSVSFGPFGPWIDISYWTLSIEIVFYTVVLAFLMAGRFEWIRPAALVLGAISALCWVFFAAEQAGSNLPFAEGIAWFMDQRMFALTLVDHGVFFAIGVLLWANLIDRKRSGDYLILALFGCAACIQIAHQCAQYNEIYQTSHSWITSCLWWLIAMVALVASVLFNAHLAGLPRPLLMIFRTMALMVYPLYLINQRVGKLIYTTLIEHGATRSMGFGGALVTILMVSLLVAAVLERPLQRRIRSLLKRAFSQRLAKGRFAAASDMT